MVERVVVADLGVVWDPNGPEAELAATDRAVATLRLRPRWDDPDKGRIAIVWRGVQYSSMGWPNDEAKSGHRLYAKGLREVLWAGEVLDSELIDEIGRRNRIAFPSTRGDDTGRHWIVLTKEITVEVIADEIEVRREP
jgi:hypothetical protein